ncbi:MAG: DUF4349 domain-containing protein [Solirubrobacteraceae bacterium]
MSLRRNRLDDTAVAELDALDAALRGDAVAPEHADLAMLVADVRDVAPQATPAFLAELDARVHEGFPPRDDAPAGARAHRPRRRLLLGAGGIAASAMIAVAVVVSLGDDPAPLTSDTVVSDAATRAPEAATDSSEGSAAIPPAPTEEPALGRERRSVERSATLDLTVPAHEVQSTANAVVRATDRVGGIVQTSSINVGEGSPGEARFELRVPSDTLDEALAAYSKLGSVAHRTQDAQDITGAVVSAEDLLSDARAERRGLLRALGRADTRREVESIRARLRIVRADIARREAALRSVRARADLATVAVTVRGEDDGNGGPSGEEDDGWSVGDAARDAGRLLEVAAGALIVGAAAILPLLALALAGAAAARHAVRRRRERGLDAT